MRLSCVKTLNRSVSGCTSGGGGVRENVEGGREDESYVYRIPREMIFVSSFRIWVNERNINDFKELVGFT